MPTSYTLWVAWSILLLLQQASHTFSSRAKNSDSYVYNTFAAVGSNGIWFVSQIFAIDQILKIITSGSWQAAVGVGTFYTVFCVLGSLSAQWLALNHIEKRGNHVD